jgi:hypothetical protein
VTGTEIVRRWIATLVAALAFAVGAGCASGTSSASGFCSTHACIPSFDQGHGSIVQCADGMWSHSGGIQGACSGHGGEGY